MNFELLEKINFLETLLPPIKILQLLMSIASERAKKDVLTHPDLHPSVVPFACIPGAVR